MIFNMNRTTEQAKEIILQKKSVKIEENGDTIVTPDTGYDGMSEVSITAQVSSTIEEIEEYDGTITIS